MGKTVIVAISGASGVVYGVRLVEALLSRAVDVRLIPTRAGRQILSHEMGFDGQDWPAFLADRPAESHPDSRLTVYRPDDLFAPPASGSFCHQGMVIAPCSMKTLGAVAAGIGGNLVHRAADVALKEKRPLILVPRETPLSAIHLENMHRLTLAGATMLPPAPGFYFHPRQIDDLVNHIVGRVLDQLGIPHRLTPRWGQVPVSANRGDGNVS
jgi:4-hydroxy-3-polyprenylbenzoate decarboxylase